MSPNSFESISDERAEEIAMEIRSGVVNVPYSDLLSLAEYLAFTSPDRKLASLVLGLTRKAIEDRHRMDRTLNKIQEVTSRFDLCR